MDIDQIVTISCTVKIGDTLFMNDEHNNLKWQKYQSYFKESNCCNHNNYNTCCNYYKISNIMQLLNKNDTLSIIEKKNNDIILLILFLVKTIWRKNISTNMKWLLSLDVWRKHQVCSQVNACITSVILWSIWLYRTKKRRIFFLPQISGLIFEHSIIYTVFVWNKISLYELSLLMIMKMSWSRNNHEDQLSIINEDKNDIFKILNC